MTPWYSDNQKPAREGLYQRRPIQSCTRCGAVEDGMTNDDEMVRVTLVLTRGGDMRTDVIAAGQVDPPALQTLVTGMAARLMYGFATDDIVKFQEPKQ